MIKLTIQSILQTILWTVVAGALYPLVMTGVIQGLFPKQAAGSLVLNSSGNLVGAVFIGQQFQGDTYFWSRPSAGTPAYVSVPSGASNLGPTSSSLQTNVRSNADAFRKANKMGDQDPVPADMVYTSASGLDPDISPEAARLQIKRVAAARNVGEDKIQAVEAQFEEPAQWGFLGEPRVKVLLLNLELDKQYPAPPKPAAPAAVSGNTTSASGNTTAGPIVSGNTTAAP